MKATLENLEKKFDLNLQAFPERYEEFRWLDQDKTGVDVLKLEQDGAALCQKLLGVSNIDSECEKLVWQFVEKVTKWAGNTGNRVRGQLDKGQSVQEIAENFRKTVILMHKGNLKSAIEKITLLRGLGISYGSKHLRMMAPERAVVLDSILREYFSYEETGDDYVRFCADCGAIAKELKNHQIKHPYRQNGEWLAADVEGAIFNTVIRTI